MSTIGFTRFTYRIVCWNLLHVSQVIRADEHPFSDANPIRLSRHLWWVPKLKERFLRRIKVVSGDKLTFVSMP